MKKIVFYSILVLMLGVLLYNVGNIKSYFDPAHKFERAWETNDSLYIKQYISNLRNEDVAEVGAIGETVLSEKTNFGYGMMYFEKRHGHYYWDEIPVERKEIIKYNIIAVWETYTKSKLFMKKKCKGVLDINGEEKTFHELYHPNRSEKFTNAELQQIKSKMDEVAMRCNESGNNTN